MGSDKSSQTKLSEDGKQLVLSALKSPLASNVVLGLILTGLERIVDVEFACPCDPKWNAFFASVFLICPGVVAAALMLVIQGCRCKCHQEKEKLLLIGSAPIVMWLVLVFMDGQYYVCAMTNWSGSFVIIDKADPQRWCEPTNSTSYTERMRLTQWWYFVSQFFGIAIPLVYLASFGAYKGCEMLCKKKPEKRERQPEEPNNDEETEKL